MYNYNLIAGDIVVLRSQGHSWDDDVCVTKTNVGAIGFLSGFRGNGMANASVYWSDGRHEYVCGALLKRALVVPEEVIEELFKVTLPQRGLPDAIESVKWWRERARLDRYE